MRVQQRLSAWLWVAIFVVMAVLAFMGDWRIALVFAVLAVPFLVYHALGICRKCSNLDCGFNPSGPAFLIGDMTKKGGGDDEAAAGKADPDEGLATTEPRYSDIHTLWASLAPLLVVFAVGLAAVWMLEPWLVVLLVALSMADYFFLYDRVTCAKCTNECPLNTNGEYWKWKKAQ